MVNIQYSPLSQPCLRHIFLTRIRLFPDNHQPATQKRVHVPEDPEQPQSWLAGLDD